MNVVCVDIGGTNLRAAVYPVDQATPLLIEKRPTQGKESGVLERLFHLIDSAWSAGDIQAISAACPGPLDPALGVLYATPNIPAWKDFPLRDLLEERYHVPVYLGNDANLAALGEWRFGAGQGRHDLLFLTISTGIGGAVIASDRLLNGSRGLATELGHITVIPDGPRCSCGRNGHLEAVASGSAIARYVSDRIALGQASSLAGRSGRLRAEEIAEAARAGDPLGREAFLTAGRYLGQAVADFLHMFNPELVIFGGGVSLAGDLLFGPMQESIRDHLMSTAYLDRLEFTLARLGDEAGLLGALAQAQLRLNQA